MATNAADVIIAGCRHRMDVGRVYHPGELVPNENGELALVTGINRYDGHGNEQLHPMPFRVVREITRAEFEAHGPVYPGDEFFYEFQVD